MINKLFFPILIALSLFVPNSGSVYLMPSYYSTLLTDPKIVEMPYVNFQTVLLVCGFLFILNTKKANRAVFSLGVSILILAGVGALFSLHPIGYISTIILVPIIIFLCSVDHPAGNYLFSNPSVILKSIAIFVPIYIVDSVVSCLNVGLPPGFSSYVLSTNSHTYISLLFALSIILAFKYNMVDGDIFKGVLRLSFGVYILGSFLSQTRATAIVFLIICLYHYPRRVLTLSFLLIILIPLFDLQETGLQLVMRYVEFYQNVVIFDINDSIAWSSLNSRINFWDTFINMFLDNPLSGAGGLAMNLYKYQYGFEYSDFVDPHNEFIFILAGYGLSGLFIILYFIIKLARLSRAHLQGSESHRRWAISILIYMIIAGFTNANSAKPNILVVNIIFLGFIVSTFAARRPIKKVL